MTVQLINLEEPLPEPTAAQRVQALLDDFDYYSNAARQAEQFARERDDNPAMVSHFAQAAAAAHAQADDLLAQARQILAEMG